MNCKKLPKNDAELVTSLEVLERSKETIEALMDFGKLAKSLQSDSEEDFNVFISALKDKWLGG